MTADERELLGEFRPSPKPKLVKTLIQAVPIFALVVVITVVLAPVMATPVPGESADVALLITVLTFGIPLLALGLGVPAYLFLVYKRATSTNYRVYEDELVVSGGFLSDYRHALPLEEITHVSYRQGVFQKLFGLGTVQFRATGNRSGTPSDVNMSVKRQGVDRLLGTKSATIRSTSGPLAVLEFANIREPEKLSRDMQTLVEASSDESESVGSLNVLKRPTWMY